MAELQSEQDTTLEPGNGNPGSDYGQGESVGFAADLAEAFGSGEDFGVDEAGDTSTSMSVLTGFASRYAAYSRDELQDFVDEFVEPGAEPWDEEMGTEGEEQTGDEAVWSEPDPAVEELARRLEAGESLD